MEKQALTPVHWILSLLAISGLAAVFITLLLPTIKPAITGSLRVCGLGLLFFGVGEFLNRPLPPFRLAAGGTDDDPPLPAEPARAPCMLGNLFLIASIICVFVATALFFFPYQN
ncbi:hypothetical protein [Desulfofustis limnaeus]|jgi:hypothetical protein|uniref:Uncharacterized protein n=1 Tax=Desulfofustis limnaeus TaxID=2740163 RepID=A0ABM7WC37_9BACT|nr:hypothetical protein [Desulfofustis limnaeus]MDX9896008.1 hypothetical protein [Desulfofustis sp.]BDD88528.1 hypothetical protein DPPLL_28930 [Desulfofustis limnaeus]